METAVIEWLKANKPPMMHLIITGRCAAGIDRLR
jgi:hypothetical protein